jgi:ketosteroid isomerase-like protein
VDQETLDLLLRGYRAFVAGDLEAIGEMLDPDVEWIGVGEEAMLVSRDVVLDVLAERVAEDYHVTVDRAIGLGDRAVVSMRFSRVERDPTDDRPLQTRRTFLVGRYAAVVTARDGRVVRVEEHAHLAGALDAVGLEEDDVT